MFEKEVSEVHARESQQHIDKTQELQRKLYLAAKKSSTRRFHALYDRINRLDVLWRAWKRVRANGGSAGVDEVSVEQVEERGVEAFLLGIQTELKEGKYKPRRVKRIYIPKSDGGQRPLGIPTVKDRVVQQACRIVIEPIFEANFQECSYGFRPKRSARKAVFEIKETLVRGWWVVDADIREFFDHIDHEVLMALLKQRISDRKVLKMLCRWLKAGVLEGGEVKATEKGTPQGGVISPLMANIYLHVLDKYWTERYHHYGKLIRYADDFVVICRSKEQARAAMRIICKILGKLKLELHPQKSQLVDMNSEGFDFLGFHFRKFRSRRTRKIIPLMWPAQKAMKTIRARVRACTDRGKLRIPLEEIVKELNPIIRGWANYFRAGNATKKLQDLDRYIRYRLKRMASARITRGRLNWDAYSEWLRKSRLERFYLKDFCGRTL